MEPPNGADSAKPVVPPIRALPSTGEEDAGTALRGALFKNYWRTDSRDLRDLVQQVSDSGLSVQFGLNGSGSVEIVSVDSQSRPIRDAPASAMLRTSRRYNGKDWRLSLKGKSQLVAIMAGVGPVPTVRKLQLWAEEDPRPGPKTVRRGGRRVDIWLAGPVMVEVEQAVIVAVSAAESEE